MGEDKEDNLRDWGCAGLIALPIVFILIVAYKIIFE